ncbi:MAG: flagellar biosynthesis anti-sigma factor FlgM [Desulfobacteraceae bacterium]|nr:flagellar biosynthesis anti-sigma factor FlgM [Desulfobacteraceae bacterium]
MDISSKIPPIQRTPDIKAPHTKAPAPPAPPGAKGDRVELSEQAREMQVARQAIQQMPDVDLEKVAKVKAQLKAGQYQVNAEKTAAQMLVESMVSDQKK